MTAVLRSSWPALAAASIVTAVFLLIGSVMLPRPAGPRARIQPVLVPAAPGQGCDLMAGPARDLCVHGGAVRDPR